MQYGHVCALVVSNRLLAQWPGAFGGGIDRRGMVKVSWVEVMLQ